MTRIGWVDQGRFEMKLMTTTLLSDARARLAGYRRFRKDEDGALILFSLFMFVLILWLGGMAVDLMRFETTRAKLQGTLDRATLAAADLDQILPPEEVVRDYFEKAGMIDFLDGDPIVQEGVNYRIVTANAEAQMPLFFYDIPRIFSEPFSPGLTTLEVSGSSTAEERVTDVEVSLVLDVSSSMGRNGRIENLRPAAREFVTSVLSSNSNSTEGLVTISMVPYSGLTNPGPLLGPQMNFNRIHQFNACPKFPTNIFDTTALNLTQSFDHYAYFDHDEFQDSDVYASESLCWEVNTNAIIPVTSNEAILHTAINNLRPYGNTAIDAGMKWGVGLLDPSTRSQISALAGASGTNVPSMAAGRPQDFSTPDVLKVVVLMTDGENWYGWDLFERFRTGTSFIWFDMDSDTSQDLRDIDFNQTSVQHKGLGTPNFYWDDMFYWNGVPAVSNDQYRPWEGRFRNYPNGFSSGAEYRAARQAGATSPGAPGIGPTYNNRVRNASWQELYANWELYRLNNELLSRAYNHGAIPWSAGTSGSPYNIHYDDYIDADQALNQQVTTPAEADARLSSLCAAARAEGIVIYTVAFEAPSSGQTALQDCASSPSHYFDVEGTDISTAFSAIASDIRALKLTQ